MRVDSRLLSATAPRRRARAPRRGASVELAFARIGMALEERRVPAGEGAGASGEEPSLVDTLLGRPCRGAH